MTINSRQKGAQFEREVANYFRHMRWDEEARRGQQFAGGPDSPDVVLPNLEGLHIEAKRVEKLNLYVAMSQAIRDAGEKLPLVIHRKNCWEMLTTMRTKDMAKVATLFSAHGLLDLEWLDWYK